MKISNNIIRRILLPTALASVCHADELRLTGAAGEKLSGRVSSIHEDGVVELVSPLSQDPLKLRSGAVSEIRFREEASQESDTHAMAVLVNGDQLPMAIDSLSKQRTLSGRCPPIGPLSIPGDAIRALEFGVESRVITFRGPGAPADWSGPDNRQGLDGVRHEGGKWQVSGSLTAVRKVDFPKDFILRFRLKWRSNTQPNLRMFLCGDAKDEGKPSDRYMLQFASAGLEIKRESSSGQRYASVLISDRLPGSFPDQQVDVELHVSRSKGTLTLHLDGEPVQRGIDPVSKPPAGALLVVQLHGAPAARQELSDLVVSKLDDMRMRHRSEQRGDPKMDALISRDEQRWSGSLRQIRKENTGLEIVFDCSASPAPIEIPLEEVSTVLFRDAGSPRGQVRYQIHLAGQGVLSVDSCRMSDNRLELRHPILGELSLPKESVLRIAAVAADQDAKLEGTQ